jgi:hypothetical protein
MYLRFLPLLAIGIWGTHVAPSCTYIEVINGSHSLKQLKAHRTLNHVPFTAALS